MPPARFLAAFIWQCETKKRAFVSYTFFVFLQTPICLLNETCVIQALKGGMVAARWWHEGGTLAGHEGHGGGRARRRAAWTRINDFLGLLATYNTKGIHFASQSCWVVCC